MTMIINVLVIVIIMFIIHTIIRVFAAVAVVVGEGPVASRRACSIRRLPITETLRGGPRAAGREILLGLVLELFCLIGKLFIYIYI